ncbi:MAG TPA: cytochrome c [Terriglobales bacterium]|nr:cytochrome c [Terriglobales bacterium]
MRSIRNLFLLAVVLGLLIPTVAFADSGADTFKAKCAMCHGPDGKKENPAMGTKALTGPDIQKMSVAEFVAVITNGKGKMPAYKGKLTDEQIKAVAEFVKTLK